MRKAWLGYIIAMVSVAFSLVAWTRLPPEVATHWGITGEPDDYMPRIVAAAFGPVAILVMTLLMRVLPIVDPKRDNYPRFIGAYWFLVNTLLLYVAVAHAAILANGVGLPVNVPRLLIGGMGVLMVLVGWAVGHLESNWFIGIRTPWTLASESVWRRTHLAGRWLFMGAGALVIVLSSAAARPLFIPAVIAVMVAAVGSALLSLLFWWREGKPR